MNIAIAVNKNDRSAVIPATYDEAAGVLILTVDEQTRVVDYAESDFVQAITEKWDCEALLSGVFLDRDAFIAIADYGVTRYNGAGLDVEQAFTAFLDNTLPLITDYEGGSGCGDHDDSILECSGGCGCDEEECSGNCETCQTPC